MNLAEQIDILKNNRRILITIEKLQSWLNSENLPYTIKKLSKPIWDKEANGQAHYEVLKRDEVLRKARNIQQIREIIVTDLQS